MITNEKVIDGINIKVCGYLPNDDERRKFIAYVKKCVPKNVSLDITGVVVGVTDCEYGRFFTIQYVAILDAGALIPEHKINSATEDITL